MSLKAERHLLLCLPLRVGNMLTKEEKRYYKRQTILPELSEEGQLKLKQSRVLIIGAGGLGCPILTYLTSAGVGHLGIMDSDKIELSNLHRQVLFNVEDIGLFKAEVAAHKLAKQNPYINLIALPFRINTNNASKIVQEWDIIVDASDNFTTRYIINDYSVLEDKPFVIGAIDRFYGQVITANVKDKNDQRSATYRCLFPDEPKQNQSANCNQSGVMGSLTGIIGNLQAWEVIKLISGIGTLLTDTVLVYHAQNNQFEKISFNRNEEAVNKLKNRVRLERNNENPVWHALDSEEVETELFKHAHIFDLRASEQLEIPKSKRLNLEELDIQLSKIDREEKIIFCCSYGITSIYACDAAISLDFKQVYNLTGGIKAWREYINEK